MKPYIDVADTIKANYMKKFNNVFTTQAAKTLFNIARKLREINETISQYKTDEDLTMEDLHKICDLYRGMESLEFEPFDILVEEALVEAGG